MSVASSLEFIVRGIGSAIHSEKLRVIFFSFGGGGDSKPVYGIIYISTFSFPRAVDDIYASANISLALYTTSI